MRCNRNWRKIIDPHILAYPAMIANCEIPRKFHADSRLHANIDTDLGTKQPKKKYPNRRRNHHSRGQHRCGTKDPESFNQPVPAPHKFRIVGD
jgi:hypothetical protein